MPLAGDPEKNILKLLEEVEGFDGTIKIIPLHEQDLHDGEAFMGGYRWEGVTDGNTIEVIVQNPSDSGKEIRVSTITFASDGLCYYDMYVDSTIDTNGTDIPLINRLIGEGKSSLITFERDGSYTTGSGGPKGQFGTGGNRFKAAGETTTDVLDIPAGHNIHIIVTNQSGAASDISIQARWSEKEV